MVAALGRARSLKHGRAFLPNIPPSVNPRGVGTSRRGNRCRVRGPAELFWEPVEHGGVLGGLFVGADPHVYYGRDATPTYPPITASPSLDVGGTTGGSGYLVYWDQNEEEDFLSMPSGLQGQLVPPWDPNGQMCVLPNGQFVVGYDPTLPAQDNLGSAKPYKQPADGEELDEPNGAFSGQNLYVPGPFKMPGQSIGSDSPPTANGVFNNNQTYTGCVVGAHNNVFANDIATAQGDYPPPSSGRLVEWFAPSYTTYCIIYGPTTGGTGPHHTDGSGGLEQPGMMASPAMATSSFRTWAPRACCDSPSLRCPPARRNVPAVIYPRSKVKISTFVKVSFPAGVAKDPTCGCYAVSSYIGNPSIIWVTADGQPEAGRGIGARHHRSTDLGKNPNQYNPFGIAFAPDGTLYFIDIHVVCKAALDRMWTGIERGTDHEGDLHQRPALDPGDHKRRVRFPDQRDGMCPGHPALPLSVGRASIAPLSGPSENPAPDAGPPTDTPGYRRLRLTLVHSASAQALGLALDGRRHGRRHTGGLLCDHPGQNSADPCAISLPSVRPGPWDWPTYGHDAQHTFNGRTTLTQSSVKTLKKAWDLSHPGRRHRHPHGGGRHGVRGLVGRRLLCHRPGDGEAAVEDEGEIPERGAALPGREAARPELRRRADHVLGLVPTGR